MDQTINPEIINVLQSSLMTHINEALLYVNHISVSLLYLFAALEVAFFGIGWALNHNSNFSSLLLKVLYIGFLLFIIQNFTSLLNTLMQGFLMIGEKMAPEHGLKLLQSPANIWRFGFDSSINLLKIAVHYGNTNVSGALLYLLIGFGNLLLFAGIAAQTIFLVLALYFTALVALIILPLSVFKPLQDMLASVLQQLLKAGIKLIVLMLILNVAASLWQAYPLNNVTVNTSLIAPLGLFFSVLITLFLALCLPNVAAKAIGAIRFNLFDKSTNVEISVNTSEKVSDVSSPSTTVLESGIANATQLSMAAQPLANAVQVNPEINAQTRITESSANSSVASADTLQKTKQELESAIAMNVRNYENTIRPLKKILKEILNENKKKS